ncbi:MAG: hypothetical protein IZT59_01695 [Verrucomicrobia bacterium]|nr:hypothetical protein [Verrucomicrobiota bacterium]
MTGDFLLPAEKAKEFYTATTLSTPFACNYALLHTNTQIPHAPQVSRCRCPAQLSRSILPFL